jgi:hypothetical protein
MSSYWKADLIGFQMDLVLTQYHVVKASKSLSHSVAISGGCNDDVAGLLFTLGTPAQVRARYKKMENT